MPGTLLSCRDFGRMSVDRVTSSRLSLARYLHFEAAVLKRFKSSGCVNKGTQIMTKTTLL